MQIREMRIQGEAFGQQDRREHERANLHFPITYKPTGALMELWHEATLTNLSATGLRMVSADLLELGCRLELEIVLPRRQAPYILAGQVMSEQPLPGGATAYGVLLSELTPEKQEEFDELVQFLPRS